MTAKKEIIKITHVKKKKHKNQCNNRNFTHNQEIITSSIYQIYLLH